jgi:5-oxoprolinase (ATP-hydrolysing)
VYHPYGLEGGEDAQCGQNIWVRGVPKLEGSDADVEGKHSSSSSPGKEVRYINLGGKNTASMQAGDRIIINTPGGGGWGPVGKESLSKQSAKKDPKLAWKGGSIAGRQSEAEASA